MFKNIPKVQTVTVLTKLHHQISDGSDGDDSASGWTLLKTEANVESII